MGHNIQNTYTPHFSTSPLCWRELSKQTATYILLNYPPHSKQTAIHILLNYPPHSELSKLTVTYILLKYPPHSELRKIDTGSLSLHKNFSSNAPVSSNFTVYEPVRPARVHCVYIWKLFLVHVWIFVCYNLQFCQSNNQLELLFYIFTMRGFSTCAKSTLNLGVYNPYPKG